MAASGSNRTAGPRRQRLSGEHPSNRGFQLAEVIDDRVGFEIAHGRFRISEADADHGHACRLGSGDVDATVARDACRVLEPEDRSAARAREPESPAAESADAEAGRLVAAG